MVHRKDVFVFPLFVTLLFSVSSLRDSEHSGRAERWFAMAPPQVLSRLRTRETVTATITATHVVSEIWLSSCVTHASNLPSCPKDKERDAARAQANWAAPFDREDYGLDPREMPAREEARAVRPSGVEPILSTEPPHFPHPGFQGNARNFKVFSKPKDVPEEPQPSRPSLWEEIVGLAFPYKKQGVSNLPSAPTPPLAPIAPSTDRVPGGIVTRTVTVTETTRIRGPKTVVSFSITGCLPSKLPFDLNLCDLDPTRGTQPRVPALKLTSNEWVAIGGKPSPSSVAPASMETSTASKLAPSHPEATNDEPFIPDGAKYDESDKGDTPGGGSKPSSPSEDGQSQESELLIPASVEDSELGSGFIDSRA